MVRHETHCLENAPQGAMPWRERNRLVCTNVRAAHPSPRVYRRVGLIVGCALSPSHCLENHQKSKACHAANEKLRFWGLGEIDLGTKCGACRGGGSVGMLRIGSRSSKPNKENSSAANSQKDESGVCEKNAHPA